MNRPFANYRDAAQAEREREALARELARNGGAHQRKRHRLRWPRRLRYTPSGAATSRNVGPSDLEDA